MTILIFLSLSSSCLVAAAVPAQRILDNFEDLSGWTAQHTDDVSASLDSAPGKAGKALRLTFDFTDKSGQPINGYATARREVPLDFPDNYELSFWVRGEAPGRSPSASEARDGRERPGVNTLQFKLVDDSGENVWWMNRPDFTFTHEWQQVTVRKRNVEFAWGPTADRILRHSASVEFVVSSGRDGGKGSVEFDELALRTLPPQDDSPLKPVRVSASSALAGAPTAAAVDSNRATAWRSDPRQGPEQTFEVDLGKPREVGAIVLRWRHGERATSFDVQQSLDRKDWRACGGAFARHGDTTAQELCESEARYLRLRLHKGEARSYGIEEIEIEDQDWAATRNAFFRNVAKDAPRGAYPRGFVEQPYWTIVGVDGSPAPALISEDGAVEPRKGGWSIEPFLIVDGKRLTWADVTATQSLLDGYLPIPAVRWNAGALTLDVEAFARGTRDASQLVARYRIANGSDAPVAATLQLAVRPFQVNPPAQFLNSPGGVAYVRTLKWDGGTGLQVNGSTTRLLAKPDDFVPLNSDGTVDDGAFTPLGDGSRGAYDELGRLSGALVYRIDLPAHGEREIDLVAPIAAAAALPDVGAGDAATWVMRERETVANAWRERLDRVRLALPPQGRRLADAVRTAQAHMLISRDGAALRPGTRSYARSWIRDGAMIADSLLRLGELDAARAYVDWFAPHQFANGKVPCCVDHRGSDPVPENDSHGELIHAIAQLYRYGGDRAQLDEQWPHVAAAIGYMDALRADETRRVESGAANPAFKGLLPASISHEGYSAKPMHSYWDDAWGLAGYRDAAELARVLGRNDDAVRIGRAHDEFRRDIENSVALTVQAHAIDYLPGCAELGDFDATSATIQLAPAGLQATLPPALVRGAFDRYWAEFEARANGRRDWKDYTPYEWRTVGAFARLGQRERAQAAIDFFFASGARPAGWNQWAEVVGRDPREIRFIGDMPHAWVASDFVRSTLDLFAYERYEDHALVLAAGVPADWLDGDGIAIERLRTPYGVLTYSLRRSGGEVHLHIGAGAKPPGGFVIAAPGVDATSRVRSDGRAVARTDGELRIAAAPADLVIAAAAH